MLGFYSPYYNKNIKNCIIFLLKNTPRVEDYTFRFKSLPIVLALLIVFGWIARIIFIQLGLYWFTEAGYSPVGGQEQYKIISNTISLTSLFPLLALSLSFSEWLTNRKQNKYLIFSIILFIT